MKHLIERLRIWLGCQCQLMAWRLLDPHDAWAISYTGPDGHRYGVIHHGPYSAARKHARLRGGQIDGHCAKEIPA